MNKKFFAFATAFTITTSAFTAGASAAETHTIKPGETLGSISQQYNTSVAHLKEVNNLASDLIFANETLNITENITNGLYTIQPNDTLFKIAVAHNTSIENLKAWNGLTSDTIYVGEKLAVVASSAKVAQPVATQQVQPKQQVAQKQQPAQQAQPVQKQQATQQVAQQPVQKQQAKPVSQKQQAPAQQAPATASKTLTMSATAYTAFCTGCSGVTANGTDLRANPGLKVIAVDPRVIPLGTRVWVEGYGEAIAADTGGAIKGNKIDVFIPTQGGAVSWGRKTVTVKILN